MNHKPLLDSQITGIQHHRIYNQQGQGIGWQKIWVTRPNETPLSIMQMRQWQRRQKQEEVEKNWQEVVQELKEDEIMEARLKAQKNQKTKQTRNLTKAGPKWQLSPWMTIWKEDPELRELFNNNFLHMRAVAKRKNYNREWLKELKNEQRTNPS